MIDLPLGKAVMVMMVMVENRHFCSLCGTNIGFLSRKNKIRTEKKIFFVVGAYNPSIVSV